jgi:hypothetical protein
VKASPPRRGGLAALALALVAMLVPASASAHRAGTSPDFFGVNGAMLRNFVNPDKASTLDGLAASMAGQGISWARLTFDQAVEERRQGAFNWYAPDTMVAALARHGVRGAASFVGTAPWAGDPAINGRCPWGRGYPADLAGWSGWVAAAARRYGSNGTFWAAHPELPKLPIQRWEIGNEVNSGQFWCPGANPENYASVYSASADAIQAVDPAAKVLVAGLAPRFGPQSAGNLDVPSFLARMTGADPSLRGRIPEVAIHPYAADVQNVLTTIARYRRAMAAAGMPQTPMLVNEVGWYTGGGGGVPAWRATEAQRVNLIAGVTNRLWRLNCGVSGMAPYSWITMEQNPADSEQWYGLADATTGRPHPSGLAYGQQIRLALGGGSQAPPRSVVSPCKPSSCARAASRIKKKRGRKRLNRAAKRRLMRLRRSRAACRARKAKGKGKRAKRPREARSRPQVHP